jgi:pyruvate/2-oxoglutarate dehydrogenase complex dihydrolipoamide acyltransferase (E2) component
MSTQADRKEEHEEISPVSREHEKVLTTPAVRRIAREHKIDLTKVKGR